jgi:hypothetical protein
MRTQREPPWYAKDNDRPHLGAYERAKQLATRTSRRTDVATWRAMYADRVHAQHRKRGSPRTRYNVGRSACDASHARLVKTQPRPWLVTTGGDWALQRQAKKGTSWLEGQFERLEVYRHTSRVLQDALREGTGGVRVWTDDITGEPCLERIDTCDVHVEPREAEKDAVRTMYLTRAVDRYILLDMYEGDEEACDAIMNAESYPVELLESETTDTLDDHTDLVLVVEAWRLPCGKSKGRHVICVDTKTLFEREWKRPSFPFAFMHWSELHGEFFGFGMLERMAGIQSELNDICTKNSNAYALQVPSVWVDSNSKVNVFKMVNVGIPVYTYDGATGKPPIFMTPNAVAHDFTERERELAARAMQLEGVSELSATSQVPAGMTNASGKALTVFEDIESERFLPQGRAFELLHIQIAKLLLAEARESKKPSALKVLGGKRVLEAIAFSDFSDIGEDSYLVRVFPASQLSRNPAGRLTEVQQMVELGILTDPFQLRQLLDMPDLEHDNEVTMARWNNANEMIEHALDGEQVAANVSTYDDLPYLVRTGTLMLSLARLRKAPDDVQESLRDLISTAQAYIDQMAAKAAQQAAAAAPPPMPPGAPPAAPPVPPMPAPPGAPPPDGGMPMLPAA